MWGGGGGEGDLSVRLESKVSSPLSSSHCPFAATTRERIVGPFERYILSITRRAQSRSVNEPPQPPFRKWDRILSMIGRGGGRGRIIETAPIDRAAAMPSDQGSPEGTTNVIANEEKKRILFNRDSAVSNLCYATQSLKKAISVDASVERRATTFKFEVCVFCVLHKKEARSESFNRN